MLIRKTKVKLDSTISEYVKAGENYRENVKTRQRVAANSGGIESLKKDVQDLQ